MKTLPLFAVVVLAATPALAGDATETHEEPVTQTEPVRYEGMKDQFVISLPENWHVYDQNTALRRPPGPVGVVQFSLLDIGDLQERLNKRHKEEATKAFTGIIRGATPSFTLDRSRASKGMACNGFTDEARKTLLKDYEVSAKGGSPSTVVAPPEVAEVTVGGCQGLRVKLRASPAEGEAWEFLIYAVSDGTTLYDFFLRNQEDFFEKNLPDFEKAITTLKLTRSE
jgi:hypothetical protein